MRLARRTRVLSMLKQMCWAASGLLRRPSARRNETKYSCSWEIRGAVEGHERRYRRLYELQKGDTSPDTGSMQPGIARASLPAPE